jgi:hypothetical protein
VSSKKGSLCCQYHAIHSYLYILSKRRSQARNCISATILLQRKVRIFLAMSWRRRILRGVTTLKAHYRGGKARAMIFELKRRAAVMIQTRYRQYSAQRRFHFLRQHAVVLQKYLRRSLAIIGKRKKLKGIVKLQCLWRGTMARIRTVAYRQKLVSLSISSRSLVLTPLSRFSPSLCCLQCFASALCLN